MLMIGKLSGALALSLVLWFSVDWPLALEVLAGANRALVVAAFLASMLTIVVSARKWQRLLHRGGIPLPFTIAARLYWIGSFFSNFLPTGVGGDAVRLLLTPTAQGRGPVAVSILVERLSGLFVMLLLSGLALAILPLELGAFAPQAAAIVAVLAAATLVLALLYLPHRFLWLVAACEPHLPGFARRPLGAPRGAAAELIGQGCDARAVTGAILYSLPFYGAVMLAQYLMLRAVGADVALTAVILGAPLVSLVALTPITINGLFLAEGAFVLVYASAGVAPEVALAAALLRRLVDLANSGLIGSALWVGWRVGGGGRPATRPAIGVSAARSLRLTAARG